MKNEQQILKNTDLLAWRVNNFQRQQREELARKAFFSREHDRPNKFH